MLETTGLTHKPRLAFPIVFFSMATSRAFLACVPGVNIINKAPFEFGLIFDESLEPCKAPGVDSPTLFLTSLYSFTNISQILKDYCRTFFNAINILSLFIFISFNVLHNTSIFVITTSSFSSTFFDIFKPRTIFKYPAFVITIIQTNTTFANICPKTILTMINPT
jgi:hypothetical protein